MHLIPAIRTAALSFAFGSLVAAAAPSAHAQTTPTAPAPGGAPAGAQADGGDPLVAKVNGQEIRRSDINRVIAGLPPQVQMMPPQMIMPAVVDQIINGMLVAQQGYKQNLQNTPEVKDRLKRAEERFVQEAYLTKEVEQRITEERLREAYKKHVEENPPQDEVKASHILVETEDEAKEIIQQLKQGGDFAQLAREKSKDPSAAAQGGDLGYFTKDQMVPPFAEAAFAMKTGEISEAPVQTQFGWHVIKVEDKRKSQPASFDQIKEELRNEVSEQAIAELVDQLRSGATIERFPLPDAGAPAAPGAPGAQPKQP